MEVCIVFGASGGIGQALVPLLIERGARVVGVSRTAEGVSKFPASIESAVTCDYSMERVEAVCSEAHERFGAVTGVVNLAGSVLLKPLHLTSQNEFDGVLQANLQTSFVVTRAAVKVMSDTGGSIVLCSSAVSRIGLPNHEAIAAAKGAVAAFAVATAATYASKGIRVNCVAPGLTQTPLTARITGSDAGVKASLAMHPLGRLGEPEDVARGIAFLLDPKNSWITGQVLSIDGGLGGLKK